MGEFVNTKQFHSVVRKSVTTNYIAKLVLTRLICNHHFMANSVSSTTQNSPTKDLYMFNPLKPELNPICYLLALLGAHHFLHVSRIRVKSLTFRPLMSYIYIEHPFLMFLDHTQRRSTVGRTPLDE